jgi:hypothetical protein
MKIRAIRLGLCLVALGAMVTSASCVGSETNWLDGPDDPTLDPTQTNPARALAQCLSDQDCETGSCLCGVCTVSCSRASGCPGSDSCSLGESSSYVAQCGALGDLHEGICLRSCRSDANCVAGQCFGGQCAHPLDFKEPVARAATPPPPISGGTLALIDNGSGVAVADPEHDRVHIIDLAQRAVTSVTELTVGDEPGRLVQDAQGFVHVVLRRAGALVAIDPRSGAVRERRQVCQYPRGVAYDGANDLLHVACVGGELVTLPAKGGAPTRVLQLDDDLRDVVVEQDRLLVSRFRSAELLVIAGSGRLLTRTKPPGARLSIPKSPNVAWRLVAARDGGVVMAHQLAQANGSADTQPVSVESGGYGGLVGPCGGIVASAVTKFDADGKVLWSRQNIPRALPVDLSMNTRGQVMLAPAGVRTNTHVALIDGGGLVPAPGGEGSTGDAAGVAGAEAAEPCAPALGISSPGQTVALVFDGSDRLVMQTREPAQVVVSEYDRAPVDIAIPLNVPSVKDTGHDLFHEEMRSGLACASCHPEGTEDGHVWEFEGLGKRRTQALGGRVSATAPFHWSGDMTDFTKLVHEVMTVRMSGFRLTDEQVAAFGGWVDTISTWRPREMADAEAVERGRILFNDEQVGCASCHRGQVMTNNETVDVGTGAAFQVPSLIGVSRRAPFMHDGCAPTLLDRFGACGGGDAHGVTSHLSPSQLQDLVSYLQSL